MTAAVDPGLLPTFLAVLEHAGIAAAARSEHLSQPAVTGRIRRLEEQVGAALFTRSARGVTPTPAGERLAVRAREVLRLLALAQAEVGSPERFAALRLMASTTVAAHVLPPALARFRAQHPEVALQVGIGNTVEVIEAVREGEVPLGLVEGHARAAGVRLEAFLDDEIVPVVGSTAPFRPRTAWDLAGIPILWREPGSGTRAVVEKALRAAGVRARPGPLDLELASSEAIVGACTAGLGIAFLSRWTLRAHLQAGLLRPLPALPLTVRRTFRWALPAGGLEPAALRFVELCRRQPPV